MYDEKVYQVALSLIPGIGDKLIKQLVGYCGSPEKVFTSSPGKLSLIPRIGRKLARTISISRLLDDLLDLSVLESGQVSLNVQTGTLGDLLDRAAASAAGGSGDLEIRRKRGDEDIVLSTDLDRLAQVFINLIANARKYCDANKPSLTISTRVSGDTLLVDFIDNGTGIPTDKQGVIFEKFSRIGDTKAGGAGLGLAICREIMARLGGQVTYLPGQGGAAFRVILPLQERLAAQ